MVSGQIYRTSWKDLWLYLAIYYSQSLKMLPHRIFWLNKGMKYLTFAVQGQGHGHGPLKLLKDKKISLRRTTLLNLNKMTILLCKIMNCRIVNCEFFWESTRKDFQGWAMRKAQGKKAKSCNFIHRKLTGQVLLKTLAINFMTRDFLCWVMEKVTRFCSLLILIKIQKSLFLRNTRI